MADLVTQLQAGDRRLIALVDAATASAARLAGGHLACRPGCSDCCLGPFPITQLDAARLRLGLEALRTRDPRRALRVQERARAADAAMAPRFPGEAERGILGEDEAAREVFFQRHENQPCPALDPDTGCCDLYESRPLSCRTFGPPVRLDGEALPPCVLCFAGAPAQTVEACRITLDLVSVESPLVRLAEAQTGRTGETLVARVLSGPPGGAPLRALKILSAWRQPV